MRRLFGLVLASLLMLCAASFDASQPQTIPNLAVQVDADHAVTVPLPGRPLVEPHLATDPGNASHLVGAATVSVQNEANLSDLRCVAVASFDGAKTWVTHAFDFQGCEDPWVAILDDGTAIFVGMENRDRRIAHLWLYRSPDGGRTWFTPPHSFGPGFDHPTLAVDRSTGRFRGALYVVSFRSARDAAGRPQARLFVARSMDSGKTFADITEHEVMNVSYNPMTAAVLPDGTLLLPLNAHNRYVVDARSIARLRNALLWLVRSDDGGAHIGPLMFVTDVCNGIRNGGFPSVAVDPSSTPQRSRVFAVCLDGGRAGPFVMRSDDGANRWSDPVHVPKTQPTDEAGQRRVSDIAVNRDGIVAVSWHDRGPDTSRKCWDVFVAFSADGESFTDAHKVSSQPSCPATPANGYAAERHPFGGDYSGLAAAADGTFHLLWSDARGGYYQLRTAQVRVNR